MLPYFHTTGTLAHMKTTLVIPDPVMRRAKSAAAERGTTLSALVEAALRAYLDTRPPPPADLPPLPVWDTGGLRIDVADREALYQVLDAPRDRRLYVREKRARLRPPRKRRR